MVLSLNMTDETKDVEVIEGLSALVDLDDDTAESTVYEVGYHILPTVAEDSLERESSAITDAITKVGGEVVGNRAPMQIDLAYSVDKKIDGKREVFDSAHFGWIAFELSASDIEKVKESLDKNSNILRYLITKTSRDQVAATLADPSLDVGAPEPEVETEELADTEDSDESADTEVVQEPEEEEKA